MGNTVGSTSANFCNFFSQEKNSYILGLWCADKYFWSSSVGISNSDPALVKKFITFFRRYFSKDRLRLRIYCPPGCSNEIDCKVLDEVERTHIKKYEAKKASQVGYHLYVNSRPLLRDFVAAERKLREIKQPKTINPYFAGRFDGDGSINKDLRSDCRIVYSNEEKARIDEKLVSRIGIKKKKVYNYKSANTFCLYIYRSEAPKFFGCMSPFLQKSYRD